MGFLKPVTVKETSVLARTVAVVTFWTIRRSSLNSQKRSSLRILTGSQASLP